MTSSDQPTVPAPPVYPMKRVCPVDPPPEYARFRDGSEAWLATRYQDVRQILFDPRFSIMPSRPGFPFVSASRASMLKGEKHNFAFMDPPQHTGLRRMLTPMFTVKRIAEMAPAIERIVKELIDAVEASGPPVDLVEAFALPLPSLVIADLLGVPYEDHGFFQECARQRVDLTVAPEVSLAAGDRIFDYLDRLLRRIEADPGDGSTLLSRLATEHILPGHLAHEDAVGMARVLLLAGHDTTATQIGAGMLALLQNPRQLQELIADEALIPGAVEEMLRYATIAHHNAPRVATQDVEIGGQTIRAGEGVIASLPAANRDPTTFPDPDRFDIHRKAHHHVAFAFGPHQCLGQALARLELQIAFRVLLKRLPGLRLAIPADQLRYKLESMTCGVLALPVEW
jgi:cytochrome P450